MANIRNAKLSDAKKVSELLYDFFSDHNLFKDEKKTINSVKDNIDTFIVLTDDPDKEVLGCLRIVEARQTDDHSLVRFKHIASQGKDKEILANIIKAAEDLCSNCKIELHIAQSEDPDKDFFIQLGYVLEGALSDHYRKDEVCYILGKIKR